MGINVNMRGEKATGEMHGKRNFHKSREQTNRVWTWYKNTLSTSKKRVATLIPRLILKTNL
jgi:hypothetical protein